ncbi:MAG: glycosyltransferase [Bacteroidota bacterium]
MPAKVAVICLCYNHEKFVEEAMTSVLNQSYPSELIIVDDASTDDSVEKINGFINKHPDRGIRTLFFNENVGNCKAFNEALKLTDADYLIDLAADDILLPDRVKEGVKNMEAHPKVAVNFTNAEYIDDKSNIIAVHYKHNSKGDLIDTVPQGDVFSHVLERYYICSPTMMYRGSFFREVGGYDEALAYEDFDIIVRLSRNYIFSFTNKILVQKRKLGTAMSAKQYRKGNLQLKSTLKICYKAYELLQNKREKRALLKRISYEAKQAFIHKRFILLVAFINLGFKTILQK